MEDVHVTDDGALHKYRTEIPNTVVRGIKSHGLSVYAKWLYVYLKSVAGDGLECFQSTTTLAGSAGMSRHMISAAKEELVRQGLIRVRKGHRKNREADYIRIVDIRWANMHEFASVPGGNSGVPIGNTSKELNCKNLEEFNGLGVPIGNSSVPGGNSGVPVATPKKIPLKKEDKKEKKVLSYESTKEKKEVVSLATQAQQVLDHLKTITGRAKFRNTSQIEVVLRKGWTVEECLLVLDWLHLVRREHQPEWCEQYLDNCTPFRPIHFDKFLAAADQWEQQGRSTGTAAQRQLAIIHQVYAEEEARESHRDQRHHH